MCGDEPYQIVAHDQNRPVRTGTAKDAALWCSGLLYMTAGDGSDLIVWNPFSLSQLLSKRGDDGSTFDRCNNSDSMHTRRLRRLGAASKQQRTENGETGGCAFDASDVALYTTHTHTNTNTHTYIQYVLGPAGYRSCRDYSEGES